MKTNAFMGNNTNLYKNLKKSIADADCIDIIVSFVMESGVKLIIDDLKSAINRGVKIRILTGNYLNITQPHALYLLRSELGDDFELRFYNVNKSFHPKAYIFHCDDNGEIYVGSSNLSKGALTNSIEWNYHFKKSEHPDDFNQFFNNFEELFYNYSIDVTDDVLREYSKNWIKPKMNFGSSVSTSVLDNGGDSESSSNLSESVDSIEGSKLVGVESVLDSVEYEPQGAQIEALYSLNKCRDEGYDKALVVAATGIGKTYLSAFDSKGYDKVLFVAHREEIIHQAAESFKNIYPNKSIGFFYSNNKDLNADCTFALVQTLGKDIYLNDDYFKDDYFDYIIIDEFHHAVAGNYKNILNYFKPKFLLGLTATPERLDNKDVFALCDYNNVYELRLKEAISKGWLSPFRYYGIYDDSVDYSTIKMKNGKYDDKDLEEKLMINKRGELVYKHYMKYRSNCAMGFCSSRNHAEYMAKFFNEKGIPSVAVYSGAQGEYCEERDIAISKLKSGELKVLFSVDMFNEGVDVPSIDTVLFLRPTQSPTVFLQQLGRGLRNDDNKEFLTVLDFIGNYKKANLVPFLLSGQNYDSKVLVKGGSPLEFEYPLDCFIDFDFELIDLFKQQAKNEVKVKDKIFMEYGEIKENLGHVPSRMDLFLGFDDNLLQALKKNRKYDLFKDYITFLNDHNELNSEEEILLDTIAHEFFNTLETTSMTKSYKMPIFKAFYNNGNIKMAITDDDVYKNMKEFYDYKSNGVDMLKHKSSKDYKSWGKREYLNLARKNPIKFLKKSSGDFFVEKEGYELALVDGLEEYIHLESFKHHFNDIIEYRTLSYYKDRYEKQYLV